MIITRAGVLLRGTAKEGKVFFFFLMRGNAIRGARRRSNSEEREGAEK